VQNPKLQLQSEIQDYSIRNSFLVPASFSDFREAIERWLSRSVMSRTSSIHREVDLIAASNLAALHRRLVNVGRVGESVRIQANLIAGQNRYERLEFSTPGLTVLDPIEIVGEIGQQEALSQTPAHVTLDLLLAQGGTGIPGEPRHTFADGEPSIWQHGYVRSEYFSYPANIDMVHFFSVGNQGEAIGGLFEWLQGLWGSKSAENPQDYYSNMLGADFRASYYSREGLLSTQLDRFFSDIQSGSYWSRLPLHEQPSAGVPAPPALSEEVQRRLLENDPLQYSAFVEFIRSLERWAAEHPESVARILAQQSWLQRSDSPESRPVEH
jgi:hypothetical protein